MHPLALETAAHDSSKTAGPERVASLEEVPVVVAA